MSLSELRKITEQRRDVPLPHRRRDGGAVARARHRDPVAARRRHFDAARRMHQAAAPRPRSSAPCGCRSPGPSAASARSRARRPAARCSASCRAATTRRCAPKAPARSPSIGFHGYAIGGLAVGEPQEVMLQVVEDTAPRLPADQPRYLMGVGTPDDLIEAVARGIDMFDCVLPTRNGRHGAAFTRFGPINLENARHRDDPRPLDEESPHEAPRTYSRAYLHPSRARQRNAGRDAAVADQSRLLPGPDGRHARGDRAGPLCGFLRRDARRLGSAATCSIRARRVAV